MLTLDNVTKVFKTGTFGGGSTPAVRNASFEIRPGEVTALIGESGSGKSTLGKMILRLTPVTSGKITFEGTDVGQPQGQEIARVLPPRPRRVPGSVQFVQSRVPSRPRLRDDQALLLPRGEQRRVAGAGGELARVGRPQSRRRARQVHPPALRRAAAADPHRTGTAARHQDPRRRRDHQHARRLDARGRAQPFVEPQDARVSACCSSPTTCPSATTSASAPSSCAGAWWSRWARPRRCSTIPSTSTPRCC